MSVFVFWAGYLLHKVAYKKGIADENDLVKTKALKKDSEGKKREYKTGNTAVDKWLDFGGGYYGIVALIKLIFIELEQIGEFIMNWPGMNEFINDLGIGTIINFFVEQFRNFVAAITWPVDYLGRYEILEIAIFIGVTYYAYNYSRKLARAKLNESQSTWKIQS